MGLTSFVIAQGETRPHQPSTLNQNSCTTRMSPIKKELPPCGASGPLTRFPGCTGGQFWLQGGFWLPCHSVECKSSCFKQLPLVARWRAELVIDQVWVAQTKRTELVLVSAPEATRARMGSEFPIALAVITDEPPMADLGLD